MTIHKTLTTTSNRVDLEIPGEWVGKKIEITISEKEASQKDSLSQQYKQAAEENKNVSLDYQAADLEGWEDEY